MKKLFKAMCLLAVLVLFPVMVFAQDADIMVCKRTLSNGTASYMFPSLLAGNKCIPGWTAVALQDALSGMTDDLEARVLAQGLKITELEAKVIALPAPFQYDMILLEHTSNMPMPQDCIVSDGPLKRVIKPDQLPHGWDTMYDPIHGWTAVHYYKRVTTCP
jgi:hypothetical protein